MPVTLTYPGVYVQEIPSTVRTISAVATSITAFIGAAERGDLNTPTTIFSFSDYQRLFGGLSELSPMSFAVRDFFLNGGTQAIIVRLFAVKTPATDKPLEPPYAADLSFTGATGVKLYAASPGLWGSHLRATIDNKVSQAAADALSTPTNTIALTDLFNLTVTDEESGTTEVWRNLTIKDSVHRADKVLADSALVRWGLPALSSSSTTPGWLSGMTPASSIVDDTSTAETKYQQDKLSGAAAATLAADLAALNAAITAMGGQDSQTLTATNFTDTSAPKLGIHALDDADLFNLLVIPPYLAPKDGGTDPTWEGDVDTTVIATAAQYCETRRAMLLVDPPTTWTSKSKAVDGGKDFGASLGTNSANAVVFFPRLSQPNPFHNNAFESFVPSGVIAGVMARTDAQRGVWKAPAGLEATLNNVTALALNITEPENGELNPLGVNCLRTIVPAGRIVWGSRTLQGDDRLASQWKYVPVRRTALFIEESVYRGTQWVVFEPNDEPLWAQIRLNVGAFMHGLFIQGAFQGLSPKDAYFVKCDSESTTQTDINNGIVNIVIGFAPLKPAEFVVISLEQMAGQIAT